MTRAQAERLQNNTLVISDQLSLQSALGPVQLDGALALARLTRRETGECVEWVACRWELANQHPAGDRQAPHSSYAVLCPDDGNPDAETLARLQPRAGQTVILIRLVDGGQELRVLWWEHGQTRAINSIRFTGPGMLKLPEPAAGPTSEHQRVSRTRGALGPFHDRLRSLRLLLVGAGRGGAEIARQLVAAGLRHLSILDPDRLEVPNLDAMPFARPREVGCEKSLVLGRSLLANQPGMTVRAGLASVTSGRGIRLLDSMRADAVVAWVDNPAARMALGWRCHQNGLFPLIDLGTNIRRDPERNMTADIRLFAGRGQGCTGCVPMMDPAQRAAALDEIAAPDGALRRGIPVAWNASRAGSALHLNSLVAATAVELLAGYVAGTVTGSTWIRIRWPGGGVPAFDQALVGADPACPLCSQP